MDFTNLRTAWTAHYDVPDGPTPLGVLMQLEKDNRIIQGAREV